MRIVYGKSSSAGMTGSSARSASAPWPMSRRFGPRMKPGLADGERREVVVVDVALALGDVDRVDALPLGEHAEGEHGEHLRLAAGEQARAVAARQVAGGAGDRADLVERAAVGALALVEDHGAHRLLLELLEQRLDVLAVGGELLGA